jgi:hypothetical protein
MMRVSPEWETWLVTMAPKYWVRVPLERKSHHEPMPPLEGCSATQRPVGVSGVAGVWQSAAVVRRRQAARVAILRVRLGLWSIWDISFGALLDVDIRCVE